MKYIKTFKTTTVWQKLRDSPPPSHRPLTIAYNQHRSCSSIWDQYSCAQCHRHIFGCRVLIRPNSSASRWLFQPTRYTDFLLQGMKTQGYDASKRQSSANLAQLFNMRLLTTGQPHRVSGKQTRSLTPSNSKDLAR